MTNPTAGASQAKSRRKRRSRDAAADPARGSARPTAQAPGSSDLRDFTLAFFRLFGAAVTPLDKRKQGPIQVALSGDLAEHFGAPTLGLAFQSVEPGSGHQLVAHGSRMFDKMLGWLERRSALTVRRLPARVDGSEQLLRAVQPRNAGIGGLKLAEQQEPIFAFHWRMTYRADDKREELYTVLLDADGSLLTPGANDLPVLDALLTDSDPAPVQPVVHAPRRTAVTDPETGETVPPDAQWPAEDPDESPTLSPNGQRLPPLTHLVRLADRARRYAIYHADLRCVEHEADILPRLYKAVERLSNYYAQQIEELAAGNDEKQEALQADLERKVAEEVENHRLRVHVELCGYAVLYVPTASADVTLSDGRREARLRVRLNRYTGHLQRPACHACGAPVANAILCRNGHVACDDCLRQCSACAEVLCAACGVAPCAACGRELCERCGRTCHACGERACAEHLGRCPTCGDEVCDACRTPCAECGSLECRSHLRAEAVVRPEDAGPRLICGRCAVRCPGCRQFSARLATCELSGQRYCANCVAVCTGCGRTAGPGFFARDPQGATWCRECVQLCDTCGLVASEQTPCAACGKGACPTCALACAVCSETFCRDHARMAAGCGHVLCAPHAATCAIGGEPVCTQCSTSCAICERYTCSHHQTLCIWCGKHYCSDCVEQGVDICRTCRAAVTRGVEVDLRSEPCAAESNVAVLAPIMRWQKAANRDVTVYCGVNRIMTLLLIVRPGRQGRYAVVSRRLDRSDLERARRAR